jgi:hypothetical protein
MHSSADTRSSADTCSSADTRSSADTCNGPEAPGFDGIKVLRTEEMNTSIKKEWFI